MPFLSILQIATYKSLVELSIIKVGQRGIYNNNYPLITFLKSYINELYANTG